MIAAQAQRAKARNLGFRESRQTRMSIAAPLSLIPCSDTRRGRDGLRHAGGCLLDGRVLQRYCLTLLSTQI
jgi:hypothetical protein